MSILNFFKKENNLFNQIKNKKLLTINDSSQIFENGEIENDWGLGFEEDCNLVIYNNRLIENASSLSEFINEKVLTIEYSSISVIFNFTNDKKIIVSLKDKDWNGPEAMQLNYKGGIIVWN